MCQSAYNSSYHKSLNTSPYFAFFYRDNHLPYDIIYPTTPHEDVGLRQRVKDAQKILEITRKSIFNTQQHRLQNVNSDKQNSIEVGDLVFAREVHVNKKDHKILPKFCGPFRVLSMKFNVATIKSLRTGRISQVSLRNVKLAHHSSITKKEHKSVDEPFPIHGDNDLLPEMCHKEIKSHFDTTLLTGSESEVILDEDPSTDNSEKNDPTTSTEVLRHKKKESVRSTADTLQDQTLGGNASESTTSTFRRPSKVVKPHRVSQEETEPISSRTRGRQKVTEKVDHIYFLNVELPTQSHSGRRIPSPSDEILLRWSATPSP